MPLVFFHPTKKLPAIDENRVTQHADILLSVLDLLGVPQSPRLLWGRSVFNNAVPGLAINFTGGTWWLASGTHYLQKRNETQMQYGILPRPGEAFSDADKKAEPPENMTKILHAAMQYFNQGLRENRMLVP